MDMSSTQHSSGANSSRNLVRQAADPASRMTDALLKRSKTKGNIDQPRTLASFPAAMPPLPDTGIDEAIATLSGQQYRVFMLLGDGQTNKQIGRVLGIAESTVKAHVSVQNSDARRGRWPPCLRCMTAMRSTFKRMLPPVVE
jgi:DNA-binding NarL/FixJ family response regulator